MFERFYVTSRGKTLEARTHAGENINFTRMQIGSGSLPEGQSIEALTALITPIKYLPVSSAKSTGSTAIIQGQVTNNGIASSFAFREIGLFATDPIDGEILYAYANAGNNADLIPAYSTTPVEFTFSFNISFTNTSNVTVVIDSSLAFPTKAEMQAALAEKVDAGAIDDEAVASLPTQSAEYPSIDEGNKLGVILAKMKKWLSDLKSKKVDTANIVNNLTTTAAGKVLDARQGKALDDAKLDKANVYNALDKDAEGFALDARQGKALKELVEQSTAIMDVSSGITASSTYVDTTATVEKRAYRQGNVVMFHFTFKAAAQSASGQAIFTGLPMAYGNTMQFTAMNTTSQKPVEFAVTNTGILAYWYSNTGFAAGDQIRGSVTYICQ